MFIDYLIIINYHRKLYSPLQPLHARRCNFWPKPASQREESPFQSTTSSTTFVPLSPANSVLTRLSKAALMHRDEPRHIRGVVEEP